jgi:hypothetical protein
MAASDSIGSIIRQRNYWQTKGSLLQFPVVAGIAFSCGIISRLFR